MNSNRLSIGIVAAALIALLAYSSMFVVGAREQALVIRFGKIQSVKTEPGLYFKLPFGSLMPIAYSMSANRRFVSTSTTFAFRSRAASSTKSMPSSSTRSPMPSSFARPFRVTLASPSRGCVHGSIPHCAGFTVCAGSSLLSRRSAAP